MVDSYGPVPSYDATMPPALIDPAYRPPTTEGPGSYNRPPPSNNDPSYRPPPPPSSEPPYNPNKPHINPDYGAASSNSNPQYHPPLTNNAGLSSYPTGGPPAPISSAPSFPPPPNNVNGLITEQVQQMQGPAATTTALPLATSSKPNLKHSQTTTERALREYMSLQRSRYRKNEVGIEERLRTQASTVLGDLRTLRQEVGDMVKAAESHRWRRWIVGGAIASFIPLVRTIFRRPEHDLEAANDTEYAFRRSRSLVMRIMDSASRPGIATLTFFVFAVMYVFQNEVTLRIARSVSKRLKRLSLKVERGEEELNEADLKLLQGWRWRILQWS